jgi:GNAT superfamily N-acetyltransferase
MNTAIIRRATAADVPALAALSAAAFSAKFGHLYPPEVHATFVARTYAEPAIAALVGDTATAVWVACDGARLLGYAMLCGCRLPHPEVTSHCIELKRFYTAPDATGQGLGTRMMNVLLLPASAAAAARGGDTWLGVYSENHGAQRFYARWGFVRVGEYEFPVGPVRDREFIMRRRRPGAG